MVRKSLAEILQDHVPADERRRRPCDLISPRDRGEILAYALDHPTHGAHRVANELRLQDIEVSPTGVRGIWLRHDLKTRHKRLLRLEREVQADTFVLSEEQIALLE